jgi:type I restriction enzyme S subunit
MAKSVYIADVCKEIFAGGDVPKDALSYEKTEEYNVPIFSNGEKNCGLYGYTNNARVKEPSITVSARGTIGYTAIRTEPFVPVVRLITLTPKSEVIDLDYLFYATQNYKFEGSGTSIPQLTVPILKKYKFPLPEMSHQKAIAVKFEKLDQLISLRKQQLAKLDELVKARFVEMFGDPVVNSKRWPVETIENHIDLLTGFPFDSSGYVSKGVNICGGLIIMPQKIDWSACKHWPQITGYEDYILRPNDIVIALDRPWISNGFKIAMVDREHLPALLIQRTARIRAVDINQHYLMQSLLLGRFDKHCNITGSLVPHISPKDIKSYSVVIPPIELQNQFATFVERVDQQKQTVQQSLEKLELMKKALMQEYFG